MRLRVPIELSIAALTMKYMMLNTTTSMTTISNSKDLFGFAGFKAGTAGSYNTASAFTPDSDSS